MVNEWILVLQGTALPKQFICKSDPRFPVMALVRYSAGAMSGYNLNFGKQADMSNANTLSYAFAFRG